jgi:hypothetical protein
MLRLLLPLVLTGCTYVSKSEIDARLDELDDDGDGYTRDGGGDAALVDCDDADASINPGVEETWYDGIDSDCAGDDDYDVDLDGYQDASSGTDTPDCDDTDDTVWPGNDEDVLDATDHDCDGGANSFAGGSLGWLLDGANNLRAVFDEDSVYFSFASLEADDPESNDKGGTIWNDQALAFVYDQLDPRAEPDLLNWYTASPTDRNYTFATGQSILLDGTSLFGAVGYLVYNKAGDNRYLQIAGYDPTWTAGSERVLVPYPYPNGMSEDFSDLAFGQDTTGGLHAFGCTATGGGNLQYLRTTSDDLQAGSATANFILEGESPSLCSLYFDEDIVGNPQGTLGFLDGGSGEYVIWTFDPVADPPSTQLSDPTDYFVETSRTDLYDVADLEYLQLDAFTQMIVDAGGGRVVITSGDGFDATTGELGTGGTPVNANVMLQDGLYYVAWVDTDGAVGLAWGTLDGGFTTASMSVDFVATEAVPAVTADGLYIMVAAISGEEIAVGVIPHP